MLPHAIVAIDFGTEFTKVCYTVKSKSGDSFQATETIDWMDGGEATDILPTAVTLKQDGCKSYGWQALTDGEKMAYTGTYLAFKLDLLNKESHTSAIGDVSGRSAIKINQLLTDFFSYILKEVQDIIQPILLELYGVKWYQANIHLVLTQPAVGNAERRSKYWTDLKDGFKSAGFSALNHQIIGSLEEPLAAARYVLQRKYDSNAINFKTGDTCILADVGGGTADVCALYIKDLETFDVSYIGTRDLRGTMIGGTMLNKYLEEALINYLRSHQHLLRDGISPIDASRVLAWSSKSTLAKIKIGTTPYPGTLSEFIKFTSKALFKDSSSKDKTLGGLRFDLSDLASSMDHQVFGNGQVGSRGIWGLIGATIDNISVSGSIHERQTDKKLEDRAISFNTQATEAVNVDHIILTGGFGASPYVTTAINMAITRDKGLPPGLQTGRPKYENIGTDRVRVSGKPQLCVVLGVLDAYRTQLLAEATPVNKTRFSFHKSWPFIQKR